MASSSQGTEIAENEAGRTQPDWALRSSKAWTVVGILLLIAAATTGLVFILEALIPFIWGGFIAFLVRPIVVLFQRRMSRGLAVATTFLLILVVSILLAVLLVPQLVANLQSFAQELPGKVQQVRANVAVVSDTLNLPPAVKSVIATATDSMAEEFRAGMQSIVQFMLAAGGAAVGLGFDIFLGFIIAIWMMLGGSTLSKWSLSVLPPTWRDGAWEIGSSFDKSFGGFIRGSVIDMSILFAGCAVGFYAIGLPYSTFLALIVGLLGVIPFVGSILGGLIAIVVGFTVSPTVGVMTTVVVLVMEQLVDSFIEPIVMGKSVKLHPLAILFSLMVGGAVAGVFGMLIAIPTAAVSYTAYLYFARKSGMLEPAMELAEDTATKTP